MPPTPSTRPPPDSEEDAQPVSPVLRFGSLVGAALVSALLASAPAALRMDDVPGAWLSLAAIELLPLALAIFVFRHARVGLKAYAGERAQERSLTVALWLSATVVVFSLLGAVLRATTHHHALAGVTFAIVALVASVALIPASARIVDIALGWLQKGARARLVVAFVLLATMFGLVVLRLVHAVPPEATLSPKASSDVVDLFTFAVVAILASTPQIAGRRMLALIGPPAAVALLAVGIPRLVSSPTLAAGIAERGPLFSCPISLISDTRTQR
ncbi:MAG TPA: hypothetical protein VF407_00275 [Polyangiaceae bacterium]